MTFQSSAVGNVFAVNSGEVTLRISPDVSIKSGQIRLFDESETPISSVQIPADAHEVTVPLSRKGYFILRASAETATGQKLETSTFAAVLGPVPPETDRLSSSLGMAKIQGANELLAASGAGWTRGFTPQIGIAPDAKGEPQWWPQYNRAAPAAKYNWVEAVMSPPSYVVAPEHQKQQSISTTYPPSNWDAYRKVVRLFATSRPWVSHFEGINEPDANHWRGTDEDLVKYHRIMREEVHAAGLNQKVLGPCFWSIDLPHLQKLEKLGFLDAVDGISLHSYPNAPPEGKWIEDIRALKTYLAKAGKPDMPVYLTEYGWGTGAGDNPNPAQELTQAQYASRGVTLLASENLAASQYFVLRYAAKGDDGWSISRADNTPRPAYAAVSTAFRWLGNAQGKTVLHPTPTSFLVLFAKSGHTVAVGWDTQSTSTFAFPQPPLRLESMTGAPLKPAADGTIELSRSPVFMEFASPALAVPVAGPSLAFTRGTTVSWTGETGQLTLPKPLTVSGKQITAPLSATPGTYTGFQRLGDTFRTVQVQLKAPWEIRDLGIRWPAGASVPSVEFTATNQAEPVTVQPYLKLDSSANEFGTPVALKTGESRLISVPLRKYVYGTAIRGTAILEQRSARGVSSVQLPFGNLPVIVGHKTASWEAVPKLPSTQWLAFGPGELKSLDPADCSANLQTAYDAEALYLRAVVQDNVHAPGQGAQPLWAFDSVQYAFDLGANPQKRVLEYVSTVREDKPITWRFISSLPSLAQNVEEPRIQVQQTREGNSTTYELRIPWVTIGLDSAPKPGEKIAFNFAVNDSDGVAADRHGFEITPGIVATKDTKDFATLLFQ